MRYWDLLLFKPSESPISFILRISLGITLISTGRSHLTHSREEFQAQVPTWLPLDPDFVVVTSGIVEIILGVSLIFIFKYKVIVGLLTAGFFIAIFPGNISQYVNGIDAFGLNTDRDRFLRLFFQPVFVIWALLGTGFFEAWRNYKNPSILP